MAKKGTFTDEQQQILETLAEMILPADDFDDGLKDAGFAGIIEARNMYQPWMAELYDIGLKGVQQISREIFGKNFLELKEEELASVFNALASDTPGGDVWTEQESALAFYTNVRQDACFVYCTDEDLWKRIGFPGAAFENGGYPDFADPQE